MEQLPTDIILYIVSIAGPEHVAIVRCLSRNMRAREIKAKKLPLSGLVSHNRVELIYYFDIDAELAAKSAAISGSTIILSSFIGKYNIKSALYSALEYGATRTVIWFVTSQPLTINLKCALFAAQYGHRAALELICAALGYYPHEVAIQLLTSGNVHLLEYFYDRNELYKIIFAKLEMICLPLISIQWIDNTYPTFVNAYSIELRMSAFSYDALEAQKYIDSKTYHYKRYELMRRAVALNKIDVVEYLLSIDPKYALDKGLLAFARDSLHMFALLHSHGAYIYLREIDDIILKCDNKVYKYILKFISR